MGCLIGEHFQCLKWHFKASEFLKRLTNTQKWISYIFVITEDMPNDGHRHLFRQHLWIYYGLLWKYLLYLGWMFAWSAGLKSSVGCDGSGVAVKQKFEKCPQRKVHLRCIASAPSLTPFGSQSWSSFGCCIEPKAAKAVSAPLTSSRSHHEAVIIGAS